ncbi:Epithelial membrane protein 2 [Bienertia sinuspersici]
MIWNVQGASSRAFLSALGETRRVNTPTVIALVETHMGGDQAQRIADQIGFTGYIHIDTQGFLGGIWVHWRTKVVHVSEVNQSMQHITMKITRLNEEPWYFSAIYAISDPLKRQDLWNYLKEFVTTYNHPWMLGGDFNDMRYNWERSSCYDEVCRRAKHFDQWIDSMELLEIVFSGPSHTWARGLTEETRRSARLDRVLCNTEWASHFSNASVKHLPAIQSDHCPPLISLNGFSPLRAINKPFRFQAAWMTHEKFQGFVENSWNNEAPLVPFLSDFAKTL